MTCSLIDLACHFGNATAPLVAFWNTWWPLGLFISGLIVGGILGWRVVLAVLTLGIGYFIYERVKNVPEPDYETGEPPTPIKPKRKTIF